ncbi:MAG: hypothetical protein GXO47_09265 [Chlorobi bacterium]|nr:hypothetical protein [Chlorobiota bacterium]
MMSFFAFGRIRRCWVLIFTALLVVSCTEEKSQLKFSGVNEKEVLAYAMSEIEGFLSEDYLKGAGREGIHTVSVEFFVDTAMPEAAFSIESKLDGDELNVALTGQTPSDALYAAYTFLEKGGYLFDITGPLAPRRFDWKAVCDYEEEIIPAVKKRGIRQHINFPMDLSAWSLNDAKKYIRNLSRMRFNYMVFHSYPGQWYEVKRKDTIEYAGHFFYGDVHPVPDYKPIKDIAVNKKYYCIPEIEPYFEDIPKRSKMAVKWLENVIKEAKKTGMKVQFSFEPRNMTTDLSRSVETVKAVLKEYPMIDALEFITEEAGGWGPRTTRSNTEKVISEHFGKDYLKDTIVIKPVKDEQGDLAYIYGQVGHTVELIKYLKKENIVPDNISLKVGIYVVIPEYAKPAFYLARKMLPETEVSLMPGHHSDRVRKNTALSVITPEDWSHSMIYSWIEFDGMMFLQQNGISGIQSIVKQAMEKTPGGRANAILYNHWRTAENKVTARYAAESALFGPVNPVRFYKKYASVYGIGDHAAFASAMVALNDADLLSMKKVSGIGFCWVGRWRNGNTVARYDADRLRETINGYVKVRDDFKRCVNTIERDEGKELVAFLDNRVSTTILYLKAFIKARELKQFDVKNGLTDAVQKDYVRISNEALAILEQYIDLYASMNADRGCSGNLVSLWYGPVKALKFLREKNGGVPFHDEVPENTAVDAPPLPVINPNK